MNIQKYRDEIGQLAETLLKGDQVLPSQETIDQCIANLASKTPDQGIGLESAFRELIDDITPAMNNQSKKHYYGFVTGGVTPAAQLADNLVTLMDQNVQVHLPSDTVASTLEDRSLRMIAELLNLDASEFTGRTLTTGATASNVLALACGREAILQKALKRKGCSPSKGVAELGLFDAMITAGIEKIQVLSCWSHSSLGKAASIVGLGRNNVIEVRHESKPWDFDLVQLENHLKKPKTASIVAVNVGEVNTGFSTSNIAQIRQLCDKYDAWMHIDGAFGIYTRVLASTDSIYAADAARWTDGLELADSITGDNHKTLNVPYDCGFFLTRDCDLLQEVFQNANAAYLASTSKASVASPLNIGIENSRRFRALPVYVTLRAYGKNGYRKFIEQMITHARKIAHYVDNSDKYELLPEGTKPDEISTIVLVRATQNNDTLKERINNTKKMYVSGTKWNNQPAVRIAVSNWSLEASDFSLPIKILDSV